MTIPSQKRYDAAVVVGRFQPLHHGHMALIDTALAVAPQVIVVLGSAFHARTPRNPFNVQERTGMVRAAVAAVDRDRLRFLPMRDYYDGARWAQAVHEGVQLMLGAPSHSASKIALVGHFKDDTAEYLQSFPNWALESVAVRADVTATAIRSAYFARPVSDAAALAPLEAKLPTSTLAFLRDWASSSAFASVADEAHALSRHHKQWASAPYPPVFVTVDALMRCADQVLLIRRAQAPGKGLLALPGGFLEPRDTIYRSPIRELREETHFDAADAELAARLKAVHVFDHPDRSERGRTITHAHYFELPGNTPPKVRADDDAAAAAWTPITALAALEDQFFDDHFQIVDHFLGLTRDHLT